MKGYRTIYPTTHDEWLEYRKNGIGSSEVPTILGVNEYETPYQLWRRKTGLDGAKEETFAMRAGHYLEPAVAQFFADETGAKIIKSSAVDFIVQDIEKPYMQVSPDRYAKLNGEKIIVECKTTQKDIDEQSIPPYWYVQLQYQLGVNRMQKGALAWLIAGRAFGYKIIDFDLELFKVIENAVTDFWLRNIQGGAEPIAVSSADIVLKGVVTDTQIQATQEESEAIYKLKEIKAEIAKLEDEKNKLEEQIKIYMNENTALVEDDAVLATWRATKTGNRILRIK